MQTKLRLAGDFQNVLITLGMGHGSLRMGSNILMLYNVHTLHKSFELSGSIQGLARVFL